MAPAGSQIEFQSNGDSVSGYLAIPATGRGPGLIVIQKAGVSACPASP